MSHDVSRRSFFGGVAAALGYLGLGPSTDLFAQNRPGAAGNAVPRMRGNDDYDAIAHLSSNENCWGPPESVMKAMNNAWKYSNRYGYPDANIVGEIAKHHGVKPENILLGAGSGEILDVVGTTFLLGGKKVLGVEPSYSSVYQHATSIKTTAIKLPLGKDYRQDMAAMIKAANTRASEIGLVYLCNPNNPTGIVVSKQEVKQLLDGIPKDMPVLIDEAYHHFVDDPSYATSVPYVIEGRPVIIARTFSKIAALAGMRLGYAVATADIVQKMRPYSMGSINALVKHGGAASLKDTAAQAEVKNKVMALRKKTTSELNALGYETLPSETNFFMVSIGREVVPVIEEFRKKGVAVGRPFPPMTTHMRVSIGTADEMARFMTAFKEIFPAKAKTTAGV
ncbi:MAG TPA: aminotransferase class I/II-fold pyridoxal phosphate-dependent enzyme [Vicinamibacterales bacterium]|jgi:histidinol-phosphate aminotransferase|nr:aminotransferase class I/II-fold pyridoxal phosphate-dependent enzyme [Vicinamibacterales bacterium]